MSPRRCSLCPSTYSGDAAFCSQCIERMSVAVADISARMARVQRGDLALCQDATEGEREDILRARRNGNFGGIVL
jgi:hypothetical protein